MNGELNVVSKENQGSTFTLTLNNVEECVPIIDDSYEQKSDIVEFKPATILVADDIVENRLLISEILKDMSFDIIEAENGLIAVEHIKNNNINLVLMDIRMPVMTGFEALKEIRTVLNLQSLPVIAVTASVMKHDLQNLKENFNAILEKPLTKASLINILRMFLEHQTTFVLDSQDNEKNSIEHLTLDEVNIVKKQILSLQEKAHYLYSKGDIQATSEFAYELLDLANRYKLQDIILWTERLITYIDSFEIEEVEYSLKNFDKTVAKWSL
jgi:CheY-like chemotaxis protein